jgi:hypothetical protein
MNTTHADKLDTTHADKLGRVAEDLAIVKLSTRFGSFPHVLGIVL